MKETKTSNLLEMYDMMIECISCKRMFGSDYVTPVICPDCAYRINFGNKKKDIKKIQSLFPSKLL